MSKTHANSIFDLPQDIIFNILSRLPTKSLIQFRCVCTSSAPLISHPSFTKLHLTTTVADNHRTFISYRSINYTYHFYSLKSLSPLNFKETRKYQFPDAFRTDRYKRYAGSNKGLICLFDSTYQSSFGTLFLWNPSINKHKILGHHKVSGKKSLFVFGFGFVSRTCEFKVVEIVYDYGANTKRTGYFDPIIIDKNNTVLVYSLSTNSWEKKKGLCAPCYLNHDWFSTTFVNGFVNWLAYREDGSRVIMAFDLDHERFQVYDLPKDIVTKDIVTDYYYLTMNSFGEEGSLSLSLSLCSRNWEVINGERLGVWVLGEYGVADSWKKVSVISHDLFPLPPLVMKNEREVLIVTRDDRLKLFDAIKNEMQDLGTLGRNHSFQAISYTASLALLDG